MFTFDDLRTAVRSESTESFIQVLQVMKSDKYEPSENLIKMLICKNQLGMLKALVDTYGDDVLTLGSDFPSERYVEQCQHDIYDSFNEYEQPVNYLAFAIEHDNPDVLKYLLEFDKVKNKYLSFKGYYPGEYETLLQLSKNSLELTKILVKAGIELPNHYRACPEVEEFILKAKIAELNASPEETSTNTPVLLFNSSKGRKRRHAPEVVSEKVDSDEPEKQKRRTRRQ